MMFLNFDISEYVEITVLKFPDMYRFPMILENLVLLVLEINYP